MSPSLSVIVWRADFRTHFQITKQKMENCTLPKRFGIRWLIAQNWWKSDIAKLRERWWTPNRMTLAQVWNRLLWKVFNYGESSWICDVSATVLCFLTKNLELGEIVRRYRWFNAIVEKEEQESSDGERRAERDVRKPQSWLIQVNNSRWKYREGCEAIKIYLLD